MKTKQQGFLSMEAMVGIAIIVSFIGLGVRALVPANSAKKVGIAAADMEQLDRGAAIWGADRATGMTGISVQVLSNDQYVATEFADGVARNPWGGNYTVAVGTEQFEYTATATALPADACAQLAARLVRKGATCTTGTVSYTLRI